MKDIQNSNSGRMFADKKTLAERYCVSVRTITNWTHAGLLAYIKIRRVIRFDIPACDAALRRQGLNNNP